MTYHAAHPAIILNLPTKTTRHLLKSQVLWKPPSPFENYPFTRSTSKFSGLYMEGFQPPKKFFDAAPSWGKGEGSSSENVVRGWGRSFCCVSVCVMHVKIMGVDGNGGLAMCFLDMDVSENSGTPKSSILLGVSIINHPFWGTTIFGNIHMCWWFVIQNCCWISPPKFNIAPEKLPSQ